MAHIFYYHPDQRVGQTRTSVYRGLGHVVTYVASAQEGLQTLENLENELPEIAFLHLTRRNEWE